MTPDDAYRSAPLIQSLIPVTIMYPTSCDCRRWIDTEILRLEISPRRQVTFHDVEKLGILLGATRAVGGTIDASHLGGFSLRPGDVVKMEIVMGLRVANHDVLVPAWRPVDRCVLNTSDVRQLGRHGDGIEAWRGPCQTVRTHVGRSVVANACIRVDGLSFQGEGEGGIMVPLEGRHELVGVARVV